METASIYYGHVLKPSFFLTINEFFLMRQFKIQIIWKLLYQNDGNKYVLIQKKDKIEMNTYFKQNNEILSLLGN